MVDLPEKQPGLAHVPKIGQEECLRRVRKFCRVFTDHISKKSRLISFACALFFYYFQHFGGAYTRMAKRGGEQFHADNERTVYVRFPCQNNSEVDERVAKRLFGQVSQFNYFMSLTSNFSLVASQRCS
jgi:hypothetical protein